MVSEGKRLVYSSIKFVSHDLQWGCWKHEQGSWIYYFHHKKAPDDSVIFNSRSKTLLTIIFPSTKHQGSQERTRGRGVIIMPLGKQTVHYLASNVLLNILIVWINLILSLTERNVVLAFGTQGKILLYVARSPRGLEVSFFLWHVSLNHVDPKYVMMWWLLLFIICEIKRCKKHPRGLEVSFVLRRVSLNVDFKYVMMWLLLFVICDAPEN